MNSRDVVTGYALGYNDGYTNGSNDQKNNDFNNGFPVEFENPDGSIISSDWGKILDLGEKTKSKYMTVCDEKYTYYPSEITYERINPVSTRYESYVDILKINLETDEITTALSHQKIGEAEGTGHTSLYESYVGGDGGDYKYIYWTFTYTRTDGYKIYKTLSVRILSTYTVMGSHYLPSYSA